MKVLFLLLISLFLVNSSASELNTVKYSASYVPKHMSVKTKKERYFALVLPAITKVHDELMQEYEAIKNDVNKTISTEKILSLKKRYKVTTDRELLLALKPHPKSIVIAQGAIESAWGTSRFFRQANNIFGMWSKSRKDKRIAAGIKRGGKHTIWLRKFDTIEESIRAYYLMIARVSAYKRLRAYRYKTDNVFKIIKGLNKYAEIGDEYVVILRKTIRYNNLTNYD